jgi:hypothetical protein
VETIRPFDTEFHRLSNADITIKSGTHYKGSIVPADSRANEKAIEIHKLHLRRLHHYPHEASGERSEPYPKNALYGGEPPQMQLKDMYALLHVRLRGHEAAQASSPLEDRRW